MKISTRSFSIGAVAIVLTFCFILAGMNNQWFEWFDRVATISDDNPDEEVIPEGFVKHGGVIRPAHDIIGRDRERDPSKEPYHPGLTPVVSVETNPNTKSLGETENNPEKAVARSAMRTAPPFDLEE